MVTISEVSAVISLLENAIMAGSYPLRTFSMSDQANHLFSCEESFEACAVGVIIIDDYWGAILPDNRLGSWEHFCKQLILMGRFKMDMSTSELWMASRLNQFVMAADLIVNRIQCLELDKAIHCLGGGTFHDYVHSTAHSVVLNHVGASTEEVNNLCFCDIIGNLQNK
jgi:hypothetical protein